MSKQMLAQLLVERTDQHERDLILNGCYIAIGITGRPVSLDLDIVVSVYVHRAAEWASGKLEGRRGKHRLAWAASSGTGSFLRHFPSRLTNDSHAP
jgi:hypothetical protein